MLALRRLLWTFWGHHAATIIVLVGLDVVANILIILLSLVSAQVYTSLLAIGSARGRLLENLSGIDLPEGIFWLWLLGGLIVLRASIDFGRQCLRGRLGEQFTESLRCRLFDHQLLMHRQHYTEKGVGRYLLRFSGDLSSLQNLFTKGILRSLGDLGLLVM
ncbi:MAG: ABC transporter transmembrane domain-containing protein, partial [Bacteroidota bacterium]